MVKPAPSAEGENTNLCFVLRPHPAPKVSSLGAVNVSEPKNSTRSLVAFFGCSRHDSFRFHAHTTLSVIRGSMASSQQVLRKRTRQKSHALRMLLTSGVIRSADVDPACMTTPRSQTGSPHILSPEKPGHARLIHTTNHLHRTDVLAHWHTTFIDILKEFGRR